MPLSSGLGLLASLDGSAGQFKVAPTETRFRTAAVDLTPHRPAAYIAGA